MSHSDAAGMGMHSTEEQQYTFNLRKRAKSNEERGRIACCVLISNSSKIHIPEKPWTQSQQIASHKSFPTFFSSYIIHPL